MADAAATLNELSDEDFRARLRAWIAANYPEHLRRPFARLGAADTTAWLQRQFRDGWRAPAWPCSYGGMGLSIGKQIIYSDEIQRHGVSRITDMGVMLLGPILIHAGTEAQKRRHLPRILYCRDIWCQGYSEPNAGSDLASLSTSAVADGDHFVVNGQKIWTTYATKATHIFLLVRTARLARKQQGITFLLVDLATPGITVRPIINLAGEESFCEVFFDDVRVPAENVVGAVNEGWAVAKSLLTVERIDIGSPTLARHALAQLQRVATALNLFADAGFRDRYAKLACDVHDVACLHGELCAAVETGAVHDAQFSVLKILASELFQRVTELAIESAGGFAGVAGVAQIGPLQEDIHHAFMAARPATIYGGTSEIQRNILAKSVLDLA